MFVDDTQSAHNHYLSNTTCKFTQYDWNSIRKRKIKWHHKE